MTDEGPTLEALIRRLAECPSDFLAEPRIGRQGRVDVAAVVCDLIRSLGGHTPSSTERDIFRQSDPMKCRNHFRLALIACWLMGDPWFISANKFAKPALRFITEGIVELASLIHAEKFVSDSDSREELVRVCLRELELRPAGESEAQATDRLEAMNTSERRKVIAATRAAQQRAQKVREELARKARAEAEAAAKVSRE